MISHQEDSTNALEGNSAIQLSHVLIDTDFFDKPKIRALSHKFTRASVGWLVEVLALMSRATGGAVCGDVLEAVAADWGIDALEPLLAYVLEKEILERQTNGLFTNRRVQSDRAKCALVRQKTAERQARYKNKTNETQIVTSVKRVSNALSTRSSDTDTVTDTDLLLEKVGVQGEEKPFTLERPPPEQNPFGEPPPASELEQYAESKLKPPNAPEVAASALYANTGRRPLKSFPLMWISRPELVHAIALWLEAGVDRKSFPVILRAANSRLETLKAQGKNPQTVSVANWLTGWALEEALKILKSSSDLKRSQKFLERATT